MTCRRSPSRDHPCAPWAWWPSEDLRCQGDDLHVAALAQLARDRSEDARATRVLARVDQDCGVLVEADVGAVLAAERLLRAHDNCADDLALLDRAVRHGLLDGADDDVAHARVAAVRAAGHPDAEDLASPGVVCDAQSRFLLDHRARSVISTRRQRLVRLSGRLSMMRTVSPMCASLRSSCAWRVAELRTIFL